MNFDYEKLRRDLIDYYGTASEYYHVAIIDVIVVESASDEELISIAQRENFNLNNYINFKEYKKIL